MGLKNDYIIKFEKDRPIIQPAFVSLSLVIAGHRGHLLPFSWLIFSSHNDLEKVIICFLGLVDNTDADHTLAKGVSNLTRYVFLGTSPFFQ